MNRNTLLKFVGGGMDLDQRAAALEQIAADPMLMAQITLLRAELEPPTPNASRWAIPPPSLSGFPATASHMAMGGGQGHTVFFSWESLDEQVVVLMDQGDGWELLFPTDPSEALTVGELPQRPDGRRVLELVLPKADSRWAILLPQTLEWPEPMEALRRALYAGQVPTATVSISAPTAA